MIAPRPNVVVVATDPPWPPTSGGDLRIAALIRSLGELADVTPIVFPLRKASDPDASPERTIVHPTPLPGRAARAGLRIGGLAHGRHPFLEHLVRTGGPEKLAADVARIRPDIVVLTYPLTGPFLRVAAEGRASLAFDLDTSHRLIDRRQFQASRGLGRVKSATDLLVAGPMERGLDVYPDELWVSSAPSAADLARRVNARIRLVPNTVDVDRYTRYRRPLIPGVCTFVGSFDYGPNRAAAQRLVGRVLPILRRMRPDTRVRLVGRNPTAAIHGLTKVDGVELFSDASDPWEILSGFGPLVVPLDSGGGTRLKILEAIAASIPVVGTRVAFEGLELVSDRHVLVADDDEGLAAAVVGTWEDPERTEARTSAARVVIVAEYGLEALAPIMARAIRHLIAVKAQPKRSDASEDHRGGA